MATSTLYLSGLLMIVALAGAPPPPAPGPIQRTQQPTSAPVTVCPVQPIVTISFNQNPLPATIHEMTPLGTPPITVTVIAPPINQPDDSIPIPEMVFATRGLSGELIRLPMDYRGKLVVVHFWASWCGACVHEAPYWVAAHQKFKDRGVAFVGVPTDKNRALSLQNAKMKAAQAGMTWPQVFEDAPTLSLNFHIKSLPATFLVDGDTGRVLAQGNSIRGAHLDSTLEAQLKQRKPQAAASLTKLPETPKPLTATVVKNR